MNTNINTSNLLAVVGFALLTLIATYGGLPTPPRFIDLIATNVPFFKKFLQLLFLSVLVYAVQTNPDLKTTALASTIVFAIFELIKWIEVLYFPPPIVI